MDGLLEELPPEECMRLLRAGTVGRIAAIERGFPFVVPVNYRLLESAGRTWLAVRTRSGSMLDQASMPVAFEIDGIDPVHHPGWSVLVRGTVHHVDPDAFELGARFDPEPWDAAARDVWLVIKSFTTTGRQLRPPEFEWALRPTDAPTAGCAAAAEHAVVTQSRLAFVGTAHHMRGADDTHRSPSRCGLRTRPIVASWPSAPRQPGWHNPPMA
jgi:nitroimidazol reductase NimA-like FMN-containing flavoprotein (pyridoxamine 5'-phosphate oxidase superfamily)